MHYAIDLQYTIVDNFMRHTAKGETPQRLRVTEEQLPLPDELFEGLEKGRTSAMDTIPLQMALRHYLTDALYYKQIIEGVEHITSERSVEIHKIDVNFNRPNSSFVIVKLDRLLTPGQLLGVYENKARRKRLKKTQK